MPNLDLSKILVILVVALLVLGPDKLPKVARQAAGFYNDLRKFRENLDSEMRGAFGDLGTIATLPTRGKSWARSATVNALKGTSPAGTLTRPTSSQPFGAQPGSGDPPGSQPVGAVPGTEPLSGTTPSPEVAPTDAGDSDFDLTFN
jgi:Sec-independent protein translocase protein TatA